jgi:uncharacterized protein (DUF1778 family)
MIDPKKMGRPKLPPGEAKKVFPLRLSLKDVALISEAASLAKEPLSSWMRSALTKAAKVAIGNAESGADGIRARNTSV